MNRSFQTIRHYALAGTMLAAMLPWANTYAATVTSTGNEGWATAGTRTSAGVTSANSGDDLFINGAHEINVQNGDDGGGVNLHTIGAVTDSGAVNSALINNLFIFPYDADINKANIVPIIITICIRLT